MNRIARKKSPVPLHEQINEVRREIELRERLYPQWVSVGTITPTDAEERFSRMYAVLDTLQKLESANPEFVNAKQPLSTSEVTPVCGRN